MSSIFNAKFGVAALVAALFVAFGAFGFGATTTSASPIAPIAIGKATCTPNAGTPGAATGATVDSGTVLCVRVGIANTAAPFTVTASGAVTGSLVMVKATEYTSVTPAAVDVTNLAVDTNTADALVYEQNQLILNQYPVQPPALQSMSYDFTVTASCPTVNGTVTITAVQLNGPAALAQQTVVGTVACKAPTPAPDVLVSVLSIYKVDQLGSPKTAQFAIQVETPVGSGNWVSIATMNTSTTTASSNPCLSTNTACTLNPSVNNAGTFTPTTTAVLPALPAGQAVRVIEVGQAANCTLVQILDGDGDLVVQPVSLTFPARTADATLKFINSCAIAGSPNSAGSSIAVVIGGATLGLTNTTHIEINPAPGSDDDARLDIRARDSLNIPLVGAHVTVSIDKGALAMRTDTSSSAAISGYEVIEPSGPNYGAIVSGDTCDQIISQFNTNIYNGTNTNPFISNSRTIQDSFTNTDGIVSACVYVNPDMAPGITPGKITVTAIIEQPGIGLYSPYGSQNLILTATITVVGPPASIKVSASPTSVQCGEKSTIVTTVTDSVGQKVSDHTRIELVSNFGATIGGTGATLGFPGVGAVNPLSSSAAETFSGDATAFLLTSTEHVGPYEVVVASGGSVGGVLTTNVINGVTSTSYQTGTFSTAPVSAQVTVTCALPVVAVAPAASAPIAAPRTGEGIRPPNTGDAGLAADNSSSTLFIIGGVMFALAGVATLKFARR